MGRKQQYFAPKNEILINGYLEYLEMGGDGISGFVTGYARKFGVTKLHLRKVLEKHERRLFEQQRRASLGNEFQPLDPSLRGPRKES